jgi:hypothetical protein
MGFTPQEARTAREHRRKSSKSSQASPLGRQSFSM